MKDQTAITTAWIRNAADERAAGRGYRFDLERAAWAVWWIERFCRLYEGDWAGQPLVLRGAWSQSLEPCLDEWDAGGKKKTIKRLREYAECVKAGERCDWQLESVARLFGWVGFEERWGREVRRFQRGLILVAKKNKKTPSMAAVALYLLCGDGEQGAKVFLGAKDGQQVRKNVSQHILQMIDQSPELRAACKVNLNEMSVGHLESRSFLMPLSSSNERTQKSKEGLNGSVLIDELHVCDREFMGRLTRMGLSRSEPIILQFSTAGDDPDSYGKEERDKGAEVNAGRRDNDRYFFTEYAAPQDLEDSELAADPEKYLTMANPALGHTIDIKEALDDYRQSLNSTIAEFGRFKMYRLNIWQRAASPWIRPNDWLRCGRLFTAESLHEQPCGAALDLGQTDDMTALSLVFPEVPEEWAEAAREAKEEIKAGVEGQPDQEKQAAAVKSLDLPVKVLTYYWLPEAAVVKYGAQVPYADWARDGFLRVTSGATVDQNELLADMLEIFGQFAVKMFAFDPWFAQPIVDALRKSVDFPEEYCWPFRQTVGKFAYPAALFERLILSGKLHHNGHPITAWQAGHVQCKTDASGNMRPVKPDKLNRKKIDGVVATIMALDAATFMESVYDSCYEDMEGFRTV
jgi:phage terminase large subunit-like protein